MEQVAFTLFHISCSLNDLLTCSDVLYCLYSRAKESACLLSEHKRQSGYTALPPPSSGYMQEWHKCFLMKDIVHGDALGWETMHVLCPTSIAPESTNTLHFHSRPCTSAWHLCTVMGVVAEGSHWFLRLLNLAQWIHKHFETIDFLLCESRGVS